MTATPAAQPKTIVITGATGGVGRGIAIACGEVGWEVWIAARRKAEGERVAGEVDAAGGRGRFVVCDAGNREAVDAALDEILRLSGGIDGIVHNATSGHSPIPSPLADISLDSLRDHVAVGLRGAYLLARKGHAPLLARRGSFLVLTSEAGFEGKARLAPYAGVKGAMRGFVRALAREWGPDGIRVNALAPLAASPAMDAAIENDPALAERVLGRNPLGRLGDATLDIGGAARFLLSDDARYITAHTLMVDGGACPAT